MQRATGGTNNFYITSFNGRDCGQNYMTAGGACNTGSLAVGFTGPVITPDNLQVWVQLAECYLLYAAWWVLHGSNRHRAVIGEQAHQLAFGWCFHALFSSYRSRTSSCGPHSICVLALC